MSSSFSPPVRWTARTVPRACPRASCRLLVVDDYQAGAEALTAALILAGYDAQCVLDGAAALRTATAWMPDIVVLDINMPLIDGFEVARHLCQNVGTQHIVIVAFTSLDELTVRRHGVPAGFDAYCRKGTTPISLLKLLALLTP